MSTAQDKGPVWNTYEFETTPLLRATGFREYDARWRFPEDINLLGVQDVGMAFGTQLRRIRAEPWTVVVGHDYREYSSAVKQALTVGLLTTGCDVHDVGLGITPMAYYAQTVLGNAAVAMVTASHNENGWTGIKLGTESPLTHGPREMEELKQIALSRQFVTAPGGRYKREEDTRERYLTHVTAGRRLKRRLRVVVATGNGTASAFGPAALERLGCDVVPLFCDLDWTFPNYNPNPEDLEMLRSMSEAVRTSHADLGIAMDGDGDRVGVVDAEGTPVFADKVGLLIARHLSGKFPNSKFVVDVKSTGLFRADAELSRHGATVEYWITGHSYIKRRVKETGALAGFEKSGHFFFGPPVGAGYDDGLVSAVTLCELLDSGGSSLAELIAALPMTWQSPTMGPHCPDDEKYEVVRQLTATYQEMAGRKAMICGAPIAELVTVNGVRVVLEDGTWGLVRASSNKPSLVVVVESPVSEERMRCMYRELDSKLATFPSVGEYDQRL